LSVISSNTYSSDGHSLPFYVGCSGWSYTAWKGHFYPRNIDNSQWLNYYSQIFDYVEIDSSFYRVPNIFTVRNWDKRTSEEFKFTAKFPKVITHDKRLENVDKELEYFFEAVRPLQGKTLALLIQLPPSLEISEGLERLKELVPQLNNKFRYAVEVRHKSWFQELAYTFFANNNICLAWSQLADIQTPPVVTTDFVYLRLIGDRSINENDFGMIQKDRIEEMQKWAHKLKVVEEEEEAAAKVKLAIVSANNHYAGFGPATANMFRKMLNLHSVDWTAHTLDTKSDSGQSSIYDFV
jgi:uncharacterized protein YecE (DUF72 family)